MRENLVLGPDPRVKKGEWPSQVTPLKRLTKVLILIRRIYRFFIAISWCMRYDVGADGGEAGELADAGSEIHGGTKDLVASFFWEMIDVFRVF